TSGGGGALNGAMLWFNVISLKSAYNSLQTSNAPEYTTGFAASIFGVIGAASATLVSARATQKALMLRLSSTAPGMAFGNSFIGFLASNLFARLSGYPTIFLGLFSDISKGMRQERNGDSLASKYTISGGFTVATGSVLALEGALAIAGATSVIPFAGWAAAGVVLVGAVLIIGGVYLHSKANERIHTPLELWAARSIFGTRKNDGESRPKMQLDSNLKLPSYLNLIEELKAWHIETYAPLLLSSENSKSLGLKSFSSEWRDSNAWSPPNWTDIVSNNVPGSNSAVEFTILLRDYILGQSKWSGVLKFRGSDREIEISPACAMTPAGLVLNIKHDASKWQSATLTITYHPNQGLSTDTTSTRSLTLEK
ncbi:hypothetical protein IAE37_003945, partial [Pseudomonas sp. S31]|nr:hypothetical protein [Pseudomonas sp. S31]